MAQQSRFQGMVVTADFVQVPLYQVSGVNQLESKERWLELKVDYTTAAIGDKKMEWLDDVTFKFEVLLPTDESGRNFVMLMGQVTYWSIPMDGKAHQAVGYIHPRFLQRYAPELKVGARSLKELYVRVTVEVNQARVGGGFFVPRGKSTKDVNAMFQKAATMPSLTRVNDAVLGSDKTPWLFVNPGLQEPIKQTK